MATALVGLIALITSVMVVRARSLVYSAGYLSLLGLAVAGLVAALGYPIVAVVHIIIYVGAGVLFIVMSVSMIRDTAERRASRLLSAVIALMSAAPLLYLGIVTDYRGPAPSSVSDYSVLSSAIVADNWISAVLLFFSISAALMAAVSISRSRGGRG